LEQRTLGLEKEKASVDYTIKPLAEMLQCDGVFVNYDDTNRKKVQSHFRLPDIYVGYSKDFTERLLTRNKKVTDWYLIKK
jgi:capsid portal protein